MTRKPAVTTPNPWPRPLLTPNTTLSQTDLTELKASVKASDGYKKSKSFFESCDIDMLIVRLAAYCFPESSNLEEITGRTRKQIESMRRHLTDLAAEITDLNTLALPGEVHFTDLIRLFGDLEVGPIDIEHSISLAGSLDSLPTLLDEYSRALEHWPHPTYRRLLSDRNWGAYRLVQLCLWIKAVTGDFHYDELTALLTVVAQFAQQKFGEPELSHEADLVRRNVANFQARNPAVYERTELLAELAAQRYKEDNPTNEFVP